MSIETPTFDPAEHDVSTPHKVSEQQDIARLLGSGADIGAVRGLAKLLLGRITTPPETGSPELFDAIEKVQADNAAGVPNTFQQLRDQLETDYPSETSASGGDVSDQPPAA